MSREIKFRVWDKRCKCYLPTKSYHIFWLDDDVFRVCIHEPSIDMPRDSVVLQQYTGLKDKSGVEIYEGDILAEKHDGSDSEANIGVVFFSAGCFMINGGGTFYDHTYSLTPNILEDYIVIGNKFQNPELLKNEL